MKINASTKTLQIEMNMDFPNSPVVNACAELQRAYEAVAQAENI